MSVFQARKNPPELLLWLVSVINHHFWRSSASPPVSQKDFNRPWQQEKEKSVAQMVSFATVFRDSKNKDLKVVNVSRKMLV
jgi:hypothetical protein